MTPRTVALLLFAVLLGIYHCDRGFVATRGVSASVHLPILLVEKHTFCFTPDRYPFMFTWRIAGQTGKVRSLEETFQGVPLRTLRQQGKLELLGPAYYLWPSQRPDCYLNTSGAGASLTALPLFALLHALTGDLTAHPRLHWYAAKFVAAACVAASAALLWLLIQALLPFWPSLTLTLAYALGTCVYSMSSQALYQHGPFELFLVLGIYASIRAERSRALPWGALAGAALAWAVWCRATALFALAAFGVYLLIVKRRAALGMALAAAPLLALHLVYNQYYFGSPFASAHTLAAAGIATYSTGSAALWQTPLWTGLAGILVSPSRGLLVFSPFLIVGFVGLGHRRFRPAALAAIAMLVVGCKWFSWWGGWSYGYRIVVDVVPLLILCAVPGMSWLWPRRGLRALFGALVALSILVQVVGAFAYDSDGWNAKNGQDVDQRTYRYRLWSRKDNQIFHYVGSFGEARKQRMRSVDEMIADR